MKHYNFSWRISDTNSGKQVLSPISAEDREYNPLTDIAVQGDALTLKTRSELKCFEYDEDKTFHEMSETLSLSLPTDKFAVQFFNNRAKIKAAKDRTKRALLTLTLPGNAKIYRTNNVLIKFYRGIYLYFAAIMNDGDEVKVAFNNEDGAKLKLRTYAFKDGCMNIYNN